MVWKKGESGNPSGRPLTGNLDRAELRERIKVKDLVEAIQARALEGDMVAARLLLDRTWPALRATDLPAPVPLPADLTKAATAVLEAVAAGTLSPNQGQAMASVLASLARVKEATELEARIAALEQR